MEETVPKGSLFKPNWEMLNFIYLKALYHPALYCLD